MAQLDKLLILKYNEMVGVNNIYNISGDTLFTDKISINSSINVSGNTIINNNISASYVNLNTPNIYLQDVITNNIFVSGDSTFSTPFSSIDTLTISTISNINYITSNSVTFDTITVNSPIVNSVLSSNIINLQTISSGSILNINGLSSINSLLYINASSFIVNSRNLLVSQDKLNLGSFATGLSGIQIMSFSSIGYLRSSSDSSRWEFKAPQNNTKYTVVNLSLIHI
jgi:hypothetical protein